MSTPPLIGQFSGPSDNSERLPRKEPDKRTEELVKEAVEAIQKADAPPTQDEIQKNYEKGLELVGLTREDALRIMEDVLVRGFYEDKTKIGSVPLVFRTRTYNDTVRMTRFLEAEAPTYQAGVQDLIARYNTTASLVRFGDRVFVVPEDSDAKAVQDSFDERYKFLLAKPAVVMAKLMELVYKFDLKVASVFAEGAPQDF